MSLNIDTLVEAAEAAKDHQGIPFGHALDMLIPHPYRILLSMHDTVAIRNATSMEEGRKILTALSVKLTSTEFR